MCLLFVRLSRKRINHTKGISGSWMYSNHLRAFENARNGDSRSRYYQCLISKVRRVSPVAKQAGFQVNLFNFL